MTDTAPDAVSRPETPARPGTSAPARAAMGPADDPGEVTDVLPGVPGPARPGDPPGPRAAPARPAADAEKPADAAPYGLPGKPFARGPFLWGLTAALGVLTAWGLAQALVSARGVIVLTVVAAFLAVGLNPVVEGLRRWGLGRRAAISIVFLGVIVMFGLFGLAIVPPVSQETSDFVSAVPGYVQDLLANPTIKRLDADYQILANVRDYITSGGLGATVAGGILGAGAVVLDAFFSGLTLLVLTLYFLGSLPSIREYLLRLVPASRRPRTAAIGDEILAGIGGYVAGNVLISVIAGALSWLFLTVAGAKYALALALVVAVTDLIPLVGATVGAVLVSAVGFLQSATLGIACAIFFVVYQQIENYVVYPRVMRRSVDVAPAVTVIAALFGGALLGAVGALLAIPVAAAVALILREVVLPRQARL
ncbi:AI-2E family transporter [Sphaerisporangium krabiense]|uniref:Putative PurR-regulated permease PerM n=1 Tax=Sphaerisporangium krabiense TaxID=763782 RepID=A0A7W8YYZ4_9ACTN|nr:AI-2E family transporter [Sphaerisporangium krabiense]MBB5624402.1 putative PurR-regulated permease PerM [Sphaerisporangium krabiense]GII61642.1 AI-2E family transporter [Sphaerisporangium krabiense]